MEVKFHDAPKLTRSMRIAMEDLRLEELLIVYPGSREYTLAEGVRVISLKRVSSNFNLGETI